MKMTTSCIPPSMPAVQSWLGRELETRGIDAVIYTRYILSILQQDGYEPEGDILDGDPFRGSGGNPFRPLRKQSRQLAGRVSGKGKKRKGQAQRRKVSSAEDRKKIAVLECLQSVTEEECGIEGLVEELCMKLKKVQEEREEKPGSDDIFLRIEETEQKEPEAGGGEGTNQAERYYAAFPALDGNSTNIRKSSAETFGQKPKGVWSSVAGSSVLLPATSDTPESRSACVSRSSNSPTGVDERKKTRSLPSSLTPTRQNSFNSRQRRSHRPRTRDRDNASGSAVHHNHIGKYRGREPFIRYPKAGGRRGFEKPKGFYQYRKRGGVSQPVKDIQRYPPLIPLKVVFARPPSQTAAVPVVKQTAGRPSPEMPELQQSLWEERHPLRDSENGDFFLEQAVTSMAESICRGIVDSEFDCEVITQGGGEEDGGGGYSTLLDDLAFEKWAESGIKDPLEFFGDSGCASVSVVCEGDTAVLAPGEVPATAGSKWESDLAPGSPTLPEKGPWIESARSCQQATPSLLSPDLPDPSNTSEDHSANTSVSEELSVVIDDEPFTQEMNSPRSAPIGTGRGNDTLLRICHHDHSSGRAKQQQESQPSGDRETGSGWPSGVSSGRLGERQDATSEPPSENIWGGFVAEQQHGSLAEGIMSSYAPTADPTTDSSTMGDLNSALWSTYDTAPIPSIHPPKVVTWSETVLSPLVSHLKTVNPAFIEGGVYGSPYGSQNNSHYNSCSTSPGASDGGAAMLRGLWGSTEHLQELSAAATKLEEYFSPRHTPAQPLDEQSIIEDSLADSPKFLSSRSSSRFEFAQPTSSPINSDRSSPTETDDMVSETEVFEETVRRKEMLVLERALGGGGNIKSNVGRDGGGNIAAVPTQDSSRLDANSNINRRSPSLSGRGTMTAKDLDEVGQGLEKVAITVVSRQDLPRQDAFPELPDDTHYFTPVERANDSSSSKIDSLTASRALHFDLLHRGDIGGGSLSQRLVQSEGGKEGAYGRGLGNMVDEEPHDRGGIYQGSCSFAVGGFDGSTLATTSFEVGPAMGFVPDNGMSHMSDFTPHVKQDFNDQFFPFEEEVFLEGEGLLGLGDSNYCHACSNQRRDCQECRSSRGSSRLSRNSSVEDQEIDGGRHSGPTKVERGSYSSRPPERIPGKPQSSKPIKITNSR